MSYPASPLEQLKAQLREAFQQWKNTKAAPESRSAKKIKTFREFYAVIDRNRPWFAKNIGSHILKKIDKAALDHPMEEKAVPQEEVDKALAKFIDKEVFYDPELRLYLQPVATGGSGSPAISYWRADGSGAMGKDYIPPKGELRCVDRGQVQGKNYWMADPRTEEERKEIKRQLARELIVQDLKSLRGKPALVDFRIICVQSGQFWATRDGLIFHRIARLEDGSNAEAEPNFPSGTYLSIASTGSDTEDYVFDRGVRAQEIKRIEEKKALAQRLLETRSPFTLGPSGEVMCGPRQVRVNGELVTRAVDGRLATPGDMVFYPNGDHVTLVAPIPQGSLTYEDYRLCGAGDRPLSLEHWQFRFGVVVAHEDYYLNAAFRRFLADWGWGYSALRFLLQGLHHRSGI